MVHTKDSKRNKCTLNTIIHLINQIMWNVGCFIGTYDLDDDMSE